MRLFIVVLTALSLFTPHLASGQRIKDLASIQGPGGGVTGNG